MHKHLIKLLEEINKRNTVLRDVFKMNVEVYDLTKPLTPSEVQDLLAHVETEMSPEVMTCDGERKFSKARYNMLQKAEAALKELA